MHAENSSHSKNAQFIYLHLPNLHLFYKIKINNMASLQSSLLQFPSAISSLTLLLLLSLLPSMLSQDTNSSNPTIAQCNTQLLPLAACAPFVQGTSQQPAQSCCGNLKLLYSQQATCLCLLLNGTNLSLFPINATRALQLPGLCSLPVDTSACSGAHVPPSSPSSEVSIGTNTNSTAPKSTIASSPMAQSAPRPSTMGLGFGRNANAGTKLKLGGYLRVALAAASFLVAGVPLWM